MVQIHRFKVDKLIRDRLPEIMRKSSIGVFERVMEKDEYAKRLKEKLLEEATEVIYARGEKEICEELADLLEVMTALAQLNGIKWEDILNAATVKREEKGGFDKRIYNAFVEIKADNPAISYYKARSDQYPEIR